MLLRVSCMLMLLVMLAACAAIPPAGPDPFTTLPYGYNGHDLKFAWNAQRQGDMLLLQGALKNMRYPSIEDLDITFELKSPSGDTIRKAHTYVIPSSINQDDTANFDIKISLKNAPEGSYINFIYFFTSWETGRGGMMNQLKTFRIDPFGRFLSKPE